jgi:alcohol dehydrogenase (quinone), cytochrome c subunit
MTRPTQRLRIALAIVVIMLVGLLAYAQWPTHTRAINSKPPVRADVISIERGRYIAVAADCTACHTASGGKAFAGGRPIASPIGTIYSTNITPDRGTGIGRFTLDDFDRAVRHGIAKTGATLYPAMPYPSYSHINDDDIAAMYSFFMYGVRPVSNTARVNNIPWPLSIRWPLAIWRRLFVSAANGRPFDASQFTDPVVARGAYLVQGAGHCGACHTPRALTLQEKALDQSSALYLTGGQVIDGWVAVNLRGNPADGLGRWSKDDIVGTLRTARNAQTAVIGDAMSDVVVHSTQFLKEEDLQAIAAYLKTLPPAPEESSAFVPSSATSAALISGREVERGAELYVDNCAACHRTTGEGSEKVFPEIAGNSTVLSTDPSSLIHLVLLGSSLPATVTAPSTLGMPGFAWRLSNKEVAQLLTFIRSSWGNRAPSVSESNVAHVRAALNAPTPRRYQ